MTPPPCVTCAHRFKTIFILPASLAQCAAVDSFLGEGRKTYCEIERKYNGPCGPQGKLWEPRQSWVDRIIKRVRG